MAGGDGLPTAEQLARGLVAAARVVGEDPLLAFEARGGARARAAAYQALRALRPDLKVELVSRLCGLGPFGRERVKEARGAAWWAGCGAAAVAAAEAAMTAAGLARVEPAAKGPREKVLAALAEEPLSRTALRAKLKWGYAPRQLQQLLDGLLEEGAVETVVKPRGAMGRPATLYAIAGTEGAESPEAQGRSVTAGKGAAVEGAIAIAAFLAPTRKEVPCAPTSSPAMPSRSPSAPDRSPIPTSTAPGATPSAALTSATPPKPTPPAGAGTCSGASGADGGSAAVRLQDPPPQTARGAAAGGGGPRRADGGVEGAGAAPAVAAEPAAAPKDAEDAPAHGPAPSTITSAGDGPPPPRSRGESGGGSRTESDLQPEPAQERAALEHLGRRLLTALEHGPATVATLRQRLKTGEAPVRLVQALTKLRDEQLVRVSCGSNPAYGLWRLASAPGVLDDFKPAPVGGIVGYMPAERMPAAAPLVSPSCRSGARTVGRPAKCEARGPLAALNLDGTAIVDIQAKVRQGVPWPHLSRQTGKSEHGLRMAFDHGYREAQSR